MSAPSAAVAATVSPNAALPEALHEILSCPRCYGPLHQLQCRPCDVTFPMLGALPCLFAEPLATAHDWRNRWQLALDELQHKLVATNRALTQGGHAPKSATYRRLSLQQAGFETQLHALTELLQPLATFDSNEHATQLALRTRLPSHHALLSYEANVFRDWAWGTQENQGAVAEILHAMQGRRPQKVLVIGAGAGRLTYDLHQVLAPKLTIGLDSNPYLGLLAQRMWCGQTLELVEFPLAPKTLEHHAVSHTLTGASSTLRSAHSGLHYLLADGLRAPIKPHSLDLIVTPWFVDIADADTNALIPRCNQWLRPGGLWLNQGSMAFNVADPERCGSFEELDESAGEHGFTRRYHNERELPYLASPFSRHSRLETVCTTLWEKQQDAAQLPPYNALPPWLSDGEAPVPAIDLFQLQAHTTRIHAYIMSLIDGERSISDIAELLQQQKLLPKEDAQVALRGLFLKMLEEAAARRS